MLKHQIGYSKLVYETQWAAMNQGRS